MGRRRESLSLFQVFLQFLTSLPCLLFFNFQSVRLVLFFLTLILFCPELWGYNQPERMARVGLLYLGHNILFIF